ncbi:MFS transporter [Streptomyces capparidis]
MDSTGTEPHAAAPVVVTDRTRLKRARYAITLTSFLHSAVYTTWVPRIPQVQEDLGLDTGDLTLAFTGVAVGPLLAIPFVGRACWRHGSRPPVRLSLLVYCLSLALPAFAPGLLGLFLAMVVLSAANAGLAAAMNAHGVTVQAHYDRPMFASIHAANSFGGLVGSGCGALAVATGVPTPVHLGLAALTAAAIGVVVSRWLLPASADRRLSGQPCRPGTARWSLPPSLVGLGVLALCIFLTESAVTNWITVYFRDALDAPAGVASAVFTVFAATMGIGRLAADPLASRFGMVATVRAGTLLAAAGFLLSAAFHSIPVGILGLAMLGAGLAAAVPAALCAAGENPAVPRATGVAAICAVGYIGFLAGPAGFGALAGMVGLSTAFGSLAVLAVTAAAFAGAVAPRARPTTVVTVGQAPAAPGGQAPIDKETP